MYFWALIREIDRTRVSLEVCMFWGQVFVIGRGGGSGLLTLTV